MPNAKNLNSMFGGSRQWNKPLIKGPMMRPVTSLFPACRRLSGHCAPLQTSDPPLRWCQTSSCCWVSPAPRFSCTALVPDPSPFVLLWTSISGWPQPSLLSTVLEYLPSSQGSHSVKQYQSCSRLRNVNLHWKCVSFANINPEIA